MKQRRIRIPSYSMYSYLLCQKERKEQRRDGPQGSASAEYYLGTRAEAPVPAVGLVAGGGHKNQRRGNSWYSYRWRVQLATVSGERGG